MPSSSSKQHKFMEAVAHSPSFAKKAGVPQSVGQDFSKADKGRKFKEGGNIMASKMNPGFMAMMAKKKGAGKDEKSAGGKDEKSAGGKHKMPDGKMMKDSAMKKMAKGGGIEVKGKTKGTMIAMKKGGNC